jgi:hypothetical protein
VVTVLGVIPFLLPFVAKPSPPMIFTTMPPTMVGSNYKFTVRILLERMCTPNKHSVRQWRQNMHPQGTSSTRYNLFILETSAPKFKQNLITVVSAMNILVFCNFFGRFWCYFEANENKRDMNTACSCRVLQCAWLEWKTWFQITNGRNGQTLIDRKTSITVPQVSSFGILFSPKGFPWVSNYLLCTTLGTPNVPWGIISVWHVIS